MIRDYFERYALSYEMRAAKPDLTAYKIAAELVGVAPEEIFFTDDRLDNVQAAPSSRVRCRAVRRSGGVT